ncbi:MAG: DnaD domain protein [Chloroflexota bacterium]
MKAFGGFHDSETFTAVPDTFFRELLEFITDAGELKVVLYAMWSIEHMDSSLRALTNQDFAAAVLGLGPDQVKSGLEQAIEHGIMLRAGHGNSTRYFLNSPRGRAAAKALSAGTLDSASHLSSGPLERPNVFKLYEENIGPLTPLIADALKDAEGTYPAEWIVESIDLAVKNNKRSWSYCQAILRRWKEEGRGKKQNRRDDQAARQRDVEEKIRKFIRG